MERTQIRSKAMDIRLRQCGVPLRFREDIIELYPHKFKKTNLSGKQGLFLHGKPGTGKTIKALSVVLDHFKNVNHVKASEFVFGNVNEILFQIKQTYSKHYEAIKTNNGSPEELILKHYTEPDILLLDDLGVEKTTEFTNQTLYLIVNRRYENKKITFVTSNLSPDDLEEKMEDSRIISRLVSDAAVFEMTKQYRI